MDVIGARLYAAEVGQGFLSVDPMAQDYPSISGYAYVAGNPVLYNDPDGRDIMIHYQTERRDDNGDLVKDSDGNVIYDNHYVRYTPGMSKIGNEFADNVIESLNYIIAKGADPHQIIKSLALRRRDRLIIQEDNARLNPFEDETFFTAEFPSNSGVGNSSSMQINNGAPTITFNPYRALAFYNTRQPTSNLNALFGRRGYRSPAENLFHEIGHAYNFFEDPIEMAQRMFAYDKDFDNFEERNVIQGYENPASRAIHPEWKYLSNRSHHGGYTNSVDSPLDPW